MKMSRYAVCFGANGNELRNGKSYGTCNITAEDNLTGSRNVNHACWDRTCASANGFISAEGWKNICRMPTSDYVDAKCPNCQRFYYNRLNDFYKTELDKEIADEMIAHFAAMDPASFQETVMQRQREFPDREDIWDQVRSKTEEERALRGENDDMEEDLDDTDTMRISEIADQEVRFYMTQMLGFNQDDNQDKTDIDYVLGAPSFYRRRLLEALKENRNFLRDHHYEHLVIADELDFFRGGILSQDELIEWLQEQEYDHYLKYPVLRGQARTIRYVTKTVQSAVYKYILQQIMRKYPLQIETYILAHTNTGGIVDHVFFSDEIHGYMQWFVEMIFLILSMEKKNNKI